MPWQGGLASIGKTKAVGCICSQGTYKKQPMNAWMGEITNDVSLFLTLSLSLKINQFFFKKEMNIIISFFPIILSTTVLLLNSIS